MTSPTRAVLILGAALLVVYIGYSVVETLTHRAAVREDARDRGYPVEQIRSYSAWPLEYYSVRLKAATDPREAETIVAEADTTIYFLSPVTSAAGDTALIQVFRFKLGPRYGAVSIRYSAGGDVVVEGGEWIPHRQFRVGREKAIAWFMYRNQGKIDQEG